MKQALACAQLLRKSIVIGATILAFSARLGASDWPCWRGQQHNGISMETTWLTQWPASGPRRVWTAQVGEGYSSVAVVGGRVFTMGSSGNHDTIYCLNAQSGQVIWRHTYAHPERQNYGGDPGPNATSTTPTVDSGSVFALSREGLVLCLNAATGKRLWQNDLQRSTGAQLPPWGFSSSPLVAGNLVILNVCASGVALDRASGRVVWKSGTRPSGYASPVPYTTGQQRGVALFTASALAGVNPANGRVLWQHPWPTSHEVNAADPIFAGDSVFISSGYEHGCALIRVGGVRPVVVWQNRNMRNHFNSCVQVGNCLFGNDANTLKCLDMKTGQERWSMRGMGQGGLIAANGHLIVMTERGELKIVKAIPNRLTQVASSRVMSGTCWTSPVLANGFIFVRNREGELACLDVRSKK